MMMKYLVMENHAGYSLVMDESGIFHRVANLGYEVGDTITEPIFMKSPEIKKKTNWKKVSTIAAIFVCMLLASVPFINNNTSSDIIVYMSINPEIHMELNKDGKINKLVADNEDGKVLLDGYSYRGKSVSTILIELIDRAELLEYLSEGGNIRISVESELENEAETVEFDVSTALNDTYIKKYQIKIKANKEDFRKIDDVVRNGNSQTSSAEEPVTEESETQASYYRNNYDKDNASAATESSAVHSTAAASDNYRETSKATENTKPVIDPTEKTTVATKPAEPATESPTASSDETEPSSAEEDDDEDDFYWPWWPWDPK